MPPEGTAIGPWMLEPGTSQLEAFAQLSSLYGVRVCRGAAGWAWADAVGDQRSSRDCARSSTLFYDGGWRGCRGGLCGCLPVSTMMGRASALPSSPPTQQHTHTPFPPLGLVCSKRSRWRWLGWKASLGWCWRCPACRPAACSGRGFWRRRWRLAAGSTASCAGAAWLCSARSAGAGRPHSVPLGWRIPRPLAVARTLPPVDAGVRARRNSANQNPTLARCRRCWTRRAGPWLAASWHACHPPSRRPPKPGWNVVSRRCSVWRFRRWRSCWHWTSRCGAARRRGRRPEAPRPRRRLLHQPRSLSTSGMKRQVPSVPGDEGFF